MKKVFVILLTVCLMLAMTACSTAPYTCDFCGRESTSKKHTADMAGTKITVCDECYKEINALAGN